ncbi:DUF7577 domain-containing protein [Halobium salinum]|uniref:DUF7577 domain-containing protein n=1 Tax=Halobium salinum TaxID=1364940 RepID=UPI003CCD55B1
MGERRSPFNGRNQDVSSLTAQESTLTDRYVLSSSSDHTESTGDSHSNAHPDTPPPTDGIICPNCGFHNLSAYSFCSQCTARLAH